LRFGAVNLNLVTFPNPHTTAEERKGRRRKGRKRKKKRKEKGGLCDVLLLL